MTERPYLSIGEVLALLLEEFPDVTISKIRFLESQGLIDPERTPSGYRKFYDGDVERLKVILREQRENFLPLRVIRDRLESGEIDDTGQHTAPRGIRNVVLPGSDETGELHVPDAAAVVTGHHPAAQLRLAGTAPAAAPPVSLAAVAAAPTHAPTNPAADFFAPTGNGVHPSITAVPAPAPAAPEEKDNYSAPEVCERAGVTAKQLADLESYGLIAGRGTGTNAVYSPADLAIVSAAAGILAHGVEARHLRAWRQAAEREAALFEQLVTPLIRQRNPKSRQQAGAMLRELADHGAALRAAILRAALGDHFDV